MLYKIKSANESLNEVAKKFGYTDYKKFFKTMRYIGKLKAWVPGAVIEAPCEPPSPRDRPYNGQPHTDHGIRGQTFVEGLTMRDINDCFVRACALSMGETNPKAYEAADSGELVDLHELDWSSFSPVAIGQNLSCEIERLMGIFPNLPELEEVSR